ncbi:hypothetical protein [Streptomyces sp. NPDC049915]|uniref:hypothetical protein n=1 Tax=Streptomyces sp. NPDC049915 TaxID=3155510 RepID=UPI003447EFBF
MPDTKGGTRDPAAAAPYEGLGVLGAERPGRIGPFGSLLIFKKPSFVDDRRSKIEKTPRAFKNSFNNPGGSTTPGHRFLSEFRA